MEKKATNSLPSPFKSLPTRVRRCVPIRDNDIFEIEELFELVELSEVPLDQELFKVVSLDHGLEVCSHFSLDP